MTNICGKFRSSAVRIGRKTFAAAAAAAAAAGRWIGWMPFLIANSHMLDDKRRTPSSSGSSGRRRIISTSDRVSSIYNISSSISSALASAQLGPLFRNNSPFDFWTAEYKKSRHVCARRRNTPPFSLLLLLLLLLLLPLLLLLLLLLPLYILFEISLQNR